MQAIALQDMGNMLQKKRRWRNISSKGGIMHAIIKR